MSTVRFKKENKEEEKEKSRKGGERMRVTSVFWQRKRGWMKEMLIVRQK